MTSPSFSLQPPRLAVWLVNLFTVPDNAEAIVGDLLEEFSQIAHRAGVVFAQRWYWRQSLKTIVVLIYTAYRAAPWWTFAGVAGGMLARRLLWGLVEPGVRDTHVTVGRGYPFDVQLTKSVERGVVDEVLREIFKGES